MKPFFSIIMPTFNRKHRIKDAVDSLLAQTYQDFELIIVDDDSSDGTEEFLSEIYFQEIKSGKIKHIKLPENKGAAFARNEGLRSAKGDWIGYLDSDNKMHPDFLETFAKAIKENQKHEIFYGQIKCRQSQEIIGHEFDFKELTLGNFIDLGVFVHSKKIYDELGGFDASLTRLIDWDLILRYAEKYPPKFIKKVLLDYFDGSDFSRVTNSNSYVENYKKVIMNYYGQLPADEFVKLYHEPFQKLADKDLEIKKKDRELKQKEREIEIIKSSKTWKILDFYLRMLGYSFFPLVNYIKKFVYLIKSSLFTIRQEGIVNWIVRTKNYILHGEGFLDEVGPSRDNFNLADAIKYYDNERITVSSFVPFDFTPNNFGGGVRIMSVYESLSKHFNVNLIGISGYGAKFKKMEINGCFTAYLVPMSKKFYDLMVEEQKAADGLLHDILLTDGYKLIPNLVEICRLLNRNTDVFISSHPYFFKMLLEYCSEKTLVYEAHNIDYDLKKTYFENLENSSAKKYLEMVKEVERIACQKSDIIMGVSREDSAGLCRNYSVAEEKVVLVPNGKDVFSCKYSAPTIDSAKKKEVVFVGSAHGPNMEAVEFIISDLAPRDKNITYRLVGNIKAAFEGRVISENVIFTGLLSDEDLENVYKTADLAINPMFSGGGTNLKVLGYISFGLPVLSTSFGMRGFEVFGNSVYFAERENFFEVMRNTLSLSEEILRKNSLAARRICEENFDKSVITADLVKTINEIFPDGSKKRKVPKIALDGRILHRNVSGSERYIFEIAKNIGLSKSEACDLFLVNTKNYEFPGREVFIPNISNPSDKVDLFHRTYQLGDYQEAIELLSAPRSVFTFHDLILYKYPDYFSNKEAYDRYA
jgi:glycosyltransferase involved in cell wall biosynthesis